MTQINCIRVLRQQVGLPVARVAEVMDVSWQTAKKYGDADELPPARTGKARRKPVMACKNWAARPQTVPSATMFDLSSSGCASKLSDSLCVWSTRQVRLRLTFVC